MSVQIGLKQLGKICLKFVSCRATDIFFGARHRKYWAGGSQANYRTYYFDEYKTRTPIIEELGSLLTANKIDCARIIEFGCSGGNNLRLMREILRQQIEYYGLDIQQEAIEFARKEFPKDNFYVCSDADITFTVDNLPQFDVFLVAGVFVYIPQKEAQIVLNCAAQIADYVLVCDCLDRFDLASGENKGLFLHPYGYMCKHAGLEIIVPPHPLSEGNPYSLFIARSLGKSADHRTASKWQSCG